MGGGDSVMKTLTEQQFNLLARFCAGNLTTCSHDRRTVDYLVRYGLIEMRDGVVSITPFGHQVHHWIVEIDSVLRRPVGPGPDGRPQIGPDGRSNGCWADDA